MKANVYATNNESEEFPHVYPTPEVEISLRKTLVACPDVYRDHSLLDLRGKKISGYAKRYGQFWVDFQLSI